MIRDTNPTTNLARISLRFIRATAPAPYSNARRVLLAVLACLTCLGPLAAQDPALLETVPRSSARVDPVAARHGMVVAQEARAARIGVEVLSKGGNAVDAAVATG